jgi:hypothetical protein
LGGPGEDILSGGLKNDIISGGRGEDILVGGNGADLFVLNDLYDGNDTIVDFSVNQNDAIDLTTILNGESHLLSDYIRITTSGTDNFLHINEDGGGSDYTDMVIRLQQNMFQNEHLPFLWANGNLITGDIRFPLEVDVQAEKTNLAENAGESAILTIGFTGEAIPKNIYIPFTLEGTADWKSDYRLEAALYNTETESYEQIQLQDLTVPVLLKPGDQSLKIHVVPLEDTETEEIENIRFTLLEQKTFYDLAAENEVTCSISEGATPVTITASQDTLDEGDPLGNEMTISRTGALDVELEVFLQITGPAINGTDYTFIPEKITIPKDQESFVITVKAYADQTVEPVEYIEILIREGEGYTPGDPAKANMAIIDPEGPGLPALGNLNNDIKVDLKDAIIALQISAGIVPSVSFSKENEVNGDGKIGIRDALYIFQTMAQHK